MSKKAGKHKYTMWIERRTVDKLGLKLYDKVAAVVAELVSNSYDADAEKVTVTLPLGKALATKRDDKVEQSGYDVIVSDDGHGMTPEEANAFYLRVGKDRREDPKQGDRSRSKNRPVMGRKGIGKLAPFGICRKIEIRSAGGKKTPNGYKVTHFEMDYAALTKETSEKDPHYHPKPLADDAKWDPKPGTTIVMKDFYLRRVPDRETFHRQLSYRFIPLPDFEVHVRDSKTDSPEPEFTVGKTDIPIMPVTKIDVSTRPVKMDGKDLPLKGWVGLAKEAYKNVEFAGVRIYARNKVVAVTRDFGIAAGFEGEFVARSYLVGEITAEWLDEEEDLIQTHRQDILWSSDLGQALSAWGQDIIREVAKKGRQPRRDKVRDEFIKKSDLVRKAKDRFKNPELERAAVELGEKLSGFASEEELEDSEYIETFSELILTIAPHKLLVDVFRQIGEMSVKGKIDVNELVKLFQMSRVAEFASYGQIAFEKMKSIDVLQTAIRQPDTKEAALQEILEDAPWLIDSRWEVVTKDQSFKTFRGAFETWYEKKYDVKIVTTTNTKDKKEPDFIFIQVGSQLKVVEIKPPKHVFDDDDWKRLNQYDDAVTEFLDAHPQIKNNFAGGFTIILVADEMNVKDSSAKKAMKSLMDSGRLQKKGWEELLTDTRKHHEAFLEARDAFNETKK